MKEAYTFTCIVCAGLFLLTAMRMLLPRPKPDPKPMHSLVVGNLAHPVFTVSNVVDCTLHDSNCYLVRYVAGGVTNECHAWMQPVTYFVDGKKQWSGGPSQAEIDKFLEDVKAELDKQETKSK